MKTSTVNVLPIECGRMRNPSHSWLLTEYAEECGIAALGKPDPQWETYEGLERLGALFMLGAFSGSELIGFASVVVCVNPHYGRKIAVIESLFVAKAHRSGAAGSTLIAAVKDEAARRGCEAILYSAPAGGQLEAVLERRKQCVRTNTVFCEPL